MKTMYKSDLQEEVPAKSEFVEPAFAHMIGVMGMRYLKAKDLGDKVLMIETAQGLWGMLQLINLQTIFLSNATHANIAISNEMKKINRVLEVDFGIDPIHDAVTDRELTVVELVKDSYLKWDEACSKGLKEKEQRMAEKEVNCETCHYQGTKPDYKPCSICASTFTGPKFSCWEPKEPDNG